MSIYQTEHTRTLVRTALAEDLAGHEDLTCRALVAEGARLHGVLKAKAPGVVCGLPVFAEVFAALNAEVAITSLLPDGTPVVPGQVVMECTGPARAVLIAERTGLNLAQRLSGTATMVARYVECCAGTSAGIYDTRKTTPGLRALQKYAVVAGGGRNHRFGLFDQVLIKENHIALMYAGLGLADGVDAPDGVLFQGSGPAEAVARCRATLGGEMVVQCEIERLDDLIPVLNAGADLVLLDNMSPAQCAEAVRMRDRHAAGVDSGTHRIPAVARRGRAELEASGGIILATVRDFAEAGVDRISVGELTHSNPALDLSLRCTVC